MRKYLPALTFSYFVFILSHATQAQLIDTASGPRVWLRSNSGTQTPLKWLDASGHKNDATSLSGQYPSANGVLNYNPVMTFDGVDDYIKVPVSLEGLMNFTVITVYQTSDTTERGIWGTENAVTRPVAATTRRISGPDTLTDRYGKHENLAYGSTIIQTWTTSTQPSLSSFIALGSSGKTQTDKPFKGQLAEFLFYNRGISFLERAQIETYLGIKYGIGHTGHNYVSSDEKVLWDADKNLTYSNHIAGIGRDDGNLLNQKQSGSAYDSGLLIISAGTVATSNIENKTNVNNGDILIWGDNAQSLKDKAGTGKDSILSVTQRRWMMEVSGLSASQMKTNIYLDISRLPKSTEGYWLIIDRSGQGNFSADNVEYVIADNVTNGTATYKNIQWDKDGSGKDAFGFARAKNFFAVVKKIGNPTCIDQKGGHVAVTIVAGHAPYSYTLKGINNKIERNWTGSEKQNEEKYLTGGDYTVTINDNQRNQSTRVFTLVAPTTLTVDIGPDKKLVQGLPIALDASKTIPDTTAVTYKWESSFGFGSTQSKVSITESGIYQVTVTRQRDGCAFTDEVTISGSESDRLAVFPVPVQSGDPFKMSVSLQDAGTVDVKIINSSGGLVREMQGSNGSEYEFTSSISDAGLYLVVITTPKSKETYKIIVN
jgi:hypothetical protein